jgi:hypothetical protein
MRIFILRSAREPVTLLPPAQRRLARGLRQELFQEFVQRFAAFKVIEESLKGDTRSTEDWFSTMDFGVLDNHAFSACRHGKPPARIPIIAFIRKNLLREAVREIWL